MRKYLLLMGLFIISVNIYSQTLIDKGKITSYEWKISNSPYIITEKTIVPKSKTLNIEPGVEIRIVKSLVIEGNIRAIGTEETPIIFKSASNDKYWDFTLVNLNNSVIENCIIDHPQRIEVKNSSIDIQNTTIKNSKDWLLLYKSNANLTNCKIVNAGKPGVFLDEANINMKECLIDKSVDAIWMHNSSRLEVTNSNILNSDHYAFVVEGKSELKINNCIIWGNDFAFKDFIDRNPITAFNSIIQSDIVPRRNKSATDFFSEENIINDMTDYYGIGRVLTNNNQASIELNYGSNKLTAGIGHNLTDQVQAHSSEPISKSKTYDNSVIQNSSHTTKSELSDVDMNIPSVNIENNYRYALIIGNEDYTKYQTDLNSEVNVDYARVDAEVFAKYCKNTLGVPDKNIFLLTDAISTQMKREINKISKLIMYSQGNAEIIFYYAGHGIPHEVTKEAYIMPVDVSAQNIEDGIKLAWLYSKLTEYDSKNVLVFLDACFSGGARNQGLLAARGVKIKPKENLIQGNFIAFTSSSDIQSSLPYKDKQHGMFTYYLLKKLQETKGNITLGELSDYLYENVALNSLTINGKEQTPKTLVSPSLKDSWKEIRLNY